MLLNDLPPGVMPGDIPGNTAEDAALESVLEEISSSGLTADQIRERWTSQPKLLSACLAWREVMSGSTTPVTIEALALTTHALRCAGAEDDGTEDALNGRR